MKGEDIQTDREAGVLVNPSKAKGSAAEKEACAFLSQWFPACERRVTRGRNDAGDVAGTPFTVEVKRCEKWPIHRWIAELNKERKGGPGFILARRSREPWVAIVPVDTLVLLLDAYRFAEEGDHTSKCLVGYESHG